MGFFLGLDAPNKVFNLKTKMSLGKQKLYSYLNPMLLSSQTQALVIIQEPLQLCNLKSSSSKLKLQSTPFIHCPTWKSRICTGAFHSISQATGPPLYGKTTRTWELRNLSPRIQHGIFPHAISLSSQPIFPLIQITVTGHISNQA